VKREKKVQYDSYFATLEVRRKKKKTEECGNDKEKTNRREEIGIEKGGKSARKAVSDTIIRTHPSIVRTARQMS
jgi:hypothetical protein